MTREITVLTVLVIIAIVISAGTLFYVAGLAGLTGLPTGMAELSSRMEELTAAERDLASVVKDLGEVVGAEIETIRAIEERLAKVEEAIAPPEQVLMILAAVEPRNLDPAITVSNDAWRVTYRGYDRLIDYVGETTEFKPSLATSWDVSGDGLVWTFHLREGISFDDGTPVDANAVKFTLDRILKIDSAPAWTFYSIDETTVLDDYTVQITLKQPFAPFFSVLACNYANIVNPNVLKHEKEGDLAQEWLATHIDGSGPYKLTEWTPGERIVLEAKKDYWGGVPTLEKVIVRFVAESSDQLMILRKGDAHIAEGLTMEQIDTLLREKPVGVTVFEAPSMFCNYLYLNTQHDYLNNKLVRQAISYAIDYQGIVQKIMKGHAAQMRGPIPIGLWGHDETVFQYYRDVDKAKELLEEAGYPGGGFTLKFIFSDFQPTWREQAETIQSNLADIGITVNLEEYSWTIQRDKIDRGDFDICIGVWTPDYGDPEMFMNYWFDSGNWGLGGNRAFYKNDEVDTLIRQAVRESDVETRTQLYQEAQHIVVEECPYVYIFQMNYVLAMRTPVRGFIYNPMLIMMYNYQSMWIEE